MILESFYDFDKPVWMFCDESEGRHPTIGTLKIIKVLGVDKFLVKRISSEKNSYFIPDYKIVNGGGNILI